MASGASGASIASVPSRASVPSPASFSPASFSPAFFFVARQGVEPCRAFMGVLIDLFHFFVTCARRFMPPARWGLEVITQQLLRGLPYRHMNLLSLQLYACNRSLLRWLPLQELYHRHYRTAYSCWLPMLTEH